MLTHLHIDNYALIDRLDLDLRAGFSVITGETGAGKSIILGALGLLQGNRAEAKVIKDGAAKCVVEGEFTDFAPTLVDTLQAADIDVEEDSIIVRREIMAGGKSRTFINDTPATLALLKEVSAQLIDIHSQHQNLLLTRETFLIDTLDGMADNAEQLTTYREAYAAFVAAERELKRLQMMAAQSSADQDYLAFQLAQLDEAQLQEGEQEELEEESATLSHAEEIRTSLGQTSQALQSDEFDVCSALRSAASAMEGIAAYLPNAEALSERLNSARLEIDDVLSEVERAAEDVEFNPQRLAYVDERLSTIYSLQKKHHVETIAELLTLADDFRRRLDAIENADEHLARAEKARSAAQVRLSACGAQLTKSRRQAAAEIEKRLIDSLHSLGMPNVSLRFDFAARPHPDAGGCDALRFLFSANKQVALQDVAQTASGGEIARLMLSLKALIAQKQNLPTIIFDEIDTGVSGTMAEKMGRVMQQMGRNAQVICITHLPQIAALGTDHFRVHKEETEACTTSHITPLTTEQRVQELADMLSGTSVTEAALANARALLGAS